jgi:hypothetical protein
VLLYEAEACVGYLTMLLLSFPKALHSAEYQTSVLGTTAIGWRPPTEVSSVAANE